MLPPSRRARSAGEGFDVAIANPSHIESLIKGGKIVSGSSANIARFGVGVGELTAGLSSSAAEPAAGRALIQLLMRPEATELLKAKGYERMVPAVAQATSQ